MRMVKWDVGVAEALTLIFIAGKLYDKIHWSWWWVLIIPIVRLGWESLSWIGYVCLIVIEGYQKAKRAKAKAEQGRDITRDALGIGGRVH